MDSVPLKPDVYSPVAISISAFDLAFMDPFSQRQILCRCVHSLYESIVAAAGDAKETAHLADAVLFPMAIDYPILDAGLHFLPVSERKSRINSFSIFNRLFSDFASRNWRL